MTLVTIKLIETDETWDRSVNL